MAFKFDSQTRGSEVHANIKIGNEFGCFDNN
jgi:hypothetical protein